MASRCENGHRRHWFTAYGYPGARLPVCVRCGVRRPDFTIGPISGPWFVEVLLDRNESTGGEAWLMVEGFNSKELAEREARWYQQALRGRLVRVYEAGKVVASC